MKVETIERVRQEAADALAQGWSGVLGLKNQWGQIGPYVFTDPKELKQLELEPKYCLSRVARSMMENSPEFKLAVVVRGCDQRALAELVKLGRIEGEQVHLIGRDCSQEQAAQCNCEKPIYETLSCVGCWKCIEACPEKAIERVNPCPILVPNEWDEEMLYRKAIYMPFPQAVPLTVGRDPEHCLKIRGILDCKGCETVCEAKAIDHDQQDEIEEIDVGSIIVATGFDALDPTPMTEYGYGRYPNVFTNLEFERLSNATGPTSGKIVLRDPENRMKFTEPPKSVAILHCIGSRDRHYHEYCSRTCCMYALKYAHLIKDKCGHETEVYNFYIDMRCFGDGYEEFYQRIQEEGVRMIRGKATLVTDEALSPEEKGKLTVIAEDTLTASVLRVPVDMVVLCTAMEARADANDVARVFNLSTKASGFFLEEHPKLEPVSTPSAGVFLAGACQSPKDIPDTVCQAKGAAAEALALSALGKVTVSPMISEIDPDICIGCKVCIGLCPYSAIEFDERHMISVVNEAVCKGCGSCAGYCPSGAARIRHFSYRQVFAEVDGLLAGKGEIL
jgi:heterodisulfide reductase subunit A2